LNLIFTKIERKGGEDKQYLLGLSEENIEGFKCYGHGVIWGGRVLYFPKLETSISVFILDRD